MGNSYWRILDDSSLHYINDESNPFAPFKIGNIGNTTYDTSMDRYYSSWTSRQQSLWSEFTASAVGFNCDLYSELINSVSKPDEPPEIDKTEFDKIIGGETV